MSKIAWTQHDCNARHDPKIVALEDKFGAVGFVVFWVLAEMLAQAYPDFIRLSADLEWRALAKDLRVSPDEARALVDGVVEVEAFYWVDDGHLSSAAFERRAAHRRGNTAKARAARLEFARAEREAPAQIEPVELEPAHFTGNGNGSGIVGVGDAEEDARLFDEGLEAIAAGRPTMSEERLAEVQWGAAYYAAHS